MEATNPPLFITIMAVKTMANMVVIAASALAMVVLQVIAALLVIVDTLTKGIALLPLLLTQPIVMEALEA